MCTNAEWSLQTGQRPRRCCERCNNERSERRRRQIRAACRNREEAADIMRKTAENVGQTDQMRSMVASDRPGSQIRYISLYGAACHLRPCDGRSVRQTRSRHFNGIEMQLEES